MLGGNRWRLRTALLVVSRYDRQRSLANQFKIAVVLLPRRQTAPGGEQRVSTASIEDFHDEEGAKDRPLELVAGPR